MCRQPLAVALTVRSAVPCWWPAALDVEEQQSPVRLRIKPITVREQARLGIDNLHKVLSTLVIDPSEATRIVILHIRKALFVRQLMSFVGPLWLEHVTAPCLSSAGARPTFSSPINATGCAMMGTSMDPANDKGESFIRHWV